MASCISSIRSFNDSRSHEVGTAGKGMILIKGLNIGDASIHLSNNEWDDHVTIHVIDEE